MTARREKRPIPTSSPRFPALVLLERILEEGGELRRIKEKTVMRVRDTWLLDGHYFDEPSDWAISPELQRSVRDQPEEDRDFRSLLDDPEACWHWSER